MSVVNKLKDFLKKGEGEAQKAVSSAKKVADVNKDGKVNVKDAKAAGQKAVKTAKKTATKAKKAVKK